MKPERPGFAFIKNTAVPADQIHSIRPSGVRGLKLIVEAVNDGGKFDPQPPSRMAPATEARSSSSRGTAEQHLVFHIALHLPYVGGMSFKDIHGVEVNLALILLRPIYSEREPPAERAVK